MELRYEGNAAVHPNQSAAITLPRLFFEQVDDSNIGIIFGFYKTEALFSINKNSSYPPTGSRTTRQTRVISPVIAATVIESSPRNTENITIIFRVTKFNNTDMVCNINISVKVIVHCYLSFIYVYSLWLQDQWNVSLGILRIQIILAWYDIIIKHKGYNTAIFFFIIHVYMYQVL